MKNKMGVELTPAEQSVAECYEALVKVPEKDDLAPFERRNTLKAVAALWQVTNGMDLDPRQLYQIGV
jgi:hypothetical protein